MNPMNRIMPYFCYAAVQLTAAGAFGQNVASATAAHSHSHEKLAKKPNIVFILADDLGWMDTQVYGSSFYKTPNIDALAKRGMLFTNAYSPAPLCSASRASIMSGQYPARTGMMGASGHAPEIQLQSKANEIAAPQFRATGDVDVTRLDNTTYTLADSLKAAGYVTGHYGKWHLGPEPYSPLQEGFDVDVPHWSGPGPAGSYTAPWQFPPNLNFQGEAGENIEDRMAQEAVKFIDKNKDRPFFLNYWAFSVHAPFDAKKSLVAKYAKLVDPNKPQQDPTMAAMVETFDDAVGTLVSELKKQKLLDHTIIIFASDNGGNMYDWINPLDGTSKDKDHGGILPTNNAPLRGGKATIFEGGNKVPFIVDWPGVVRPSSQNNALIMLTDLYPTMIHMGGGSIHADQPLDGVSLMPLLTGKVRSVRDSVYVQFPFNVPATGNLPSAYVRTGNWVLIRTYFQNPDGTDTYELYNLISDPSEIHDVAAAHPAIVASLRAQMDAFLKDTKAVLPLRNPKFDPSKKPKNPVMGPPTPPNAYAPFISIPPPMSGHHNP